MGTNDPDVAVIIRTSMRASMATAAVMRGEEPELDGLDEVCGWAVGTWAAFLVGVAVR